MTRSLYIIGGAGTGKSTFTAALLKDQTMGAIQDLHAKRNAKALVTLRGHPVGDEGLYLGCMRESFPGTDGLDRASSPAGAEWLQKHALPLWIVAEGATLATRPFMHALAEYTDLLLVHLRADDFIKELRFRERGSAQDPKFVLATATRSQNLFDEMDRDNTCDLLEVDTAEPGDWHNALVECADWLGL